MRPRLRHALAATAASALLIPALAACGEPEVGLGEDTATGFDAVEIAGDQGKAPEVTWNAVMEVDEPEQETLVEGDGPEITGDTKASVYVYIGNGTTKSKAYSDWDNGQPMEMSPGDDSVSEAFSSLLDGAAVGSRVASVTDASEVFGEAGNAQLGVGNADTVLIVMDVMEEVVPPEPVDVPASAMPKIVEKGGEPTGFDFSGMAAPDPEGDLQRTVVKQGKGPAATLDSTVKVNYLGQVYQGEKPFDESYSKGQPTEFALNSVVQGWTYGLEGMKQGSRVILGIPPRYGYGESGNSQAGIKGTDTLYFVVDIVEVK
ncbi:FKBP-type peptidyl-prolyl cis-trans isomerase [Nocardioides insulae]|uniref:FKBP-type peptidyl-prolyl cis-trans isomerase n=1 Tax=Nocardioides insulae TaxID=394734 RepID=UPI0003FCEB49|nr:FKBP-type peptidyl-prolyl cis-trans isomerase [Nocardioides insulae]